MAKIKNIVQQLRQNKAITQEELAHKLSVSRQTIISIEKGKYVPSLELALKISKYFKLPIEQIFENEEK